ncbi:MAG TPA: sulfotransferase [Saprospiraceae bacterium]|nr:sulfotransferase [Saprospiraceae bacterium]HMQ81659.1 sulfotransferase [Saprospiraceae bacterium]
MSSTAKNPIFLGGDHRSGTTLLSLMLNAHPELVMGPEIDFLEPSDLGAHVLKCGELLQQDDPAVRGEGVLTADPQWHKGVQFIRQCQRFGLSIESLMTLVDSCRQSLGKEPESFAERCVLMDAIGRFQGRKVLKWGLKIQRNIVLLDQFLEVWPQAVFIHVIRDGRDVAASHVRSQWDWAYRSIEEAARGWISIVGHVALQANAQLIEVKYEDLLRNTKGCLADLLEKLSLPWDDSVLHYWEKEQPLLARPFNHPSAAAVRHPPYQKAIGRYKQHLSQEEIARFEKIAASALRQYGYTHHIPIFKEI